MDYSHLTPTNTPIVRVDWHDIVSADNYNEDERAQSVEVASIGWLLEDAPTAVTIAGSYVWREERWSDQQTFPKAPPEITVIKDQAPPVKRDLTEIGDNE